MAYTGNAIKLEDGTPANGDTIIPAAVIRQDTLGVSNTTDGKYGLLKTTSKDELYVKQTDAVPVTDNGGSITVDGSVAVTQSTSPWVTSLTSTTITSEVPGTGATNLGKAEDAGHTTGDTGVMALAVRNDAGTALATTTLDYIPITTDEAGATWFATIGRVSTANSTTTNLAGGAVFTGTSEEVKNYAAIQVSVFSSHASATDGLSLQQSSNGTNWDITDVYTISATTSKVISVQPAGQFFRLVYTNGATLTTSLRVQVVYHTEAPNPSSQRASDAYTNETDLTQNWTFNSLYNGTTWDRMRGDITNGLDVDVTRLPSLPTGANTIGAISNTSFAATQSGTWTVQPGNTQNTTPWLIRQKSSTSTHSRTATSTTSATILAANANRIGGSIWNDATTNLYVATNGSAASATNFKVILNPGGYFEIPAGITTAITGVLASGTGNAQVDEDT